MKKEVSTHDSTHAELELSAALFAFRDALMALSLSLKDWQFEHDLQRRQACEQATRELFEKVKTR